jgi:hypothetical protein
MAEVCSTRENEQKCIQRIGKSEGKGDLEDIRVDGKIILKLILKKRGGKV